MKPSFLVNITELLKNYPAIKLGYLFGSQATGDAGPMSDYDFAFYLEGLEAKERFDLRLELMGKISLFLKTDAIDVVILNDVQGSELKYHIIKEGILFYNEEPYRIIVEPRILNEYFDFMYGLRKYGLTSA